MALIRWAFQTSLGAAANNLPVACPNRHFWRVAWSCSLIGKFRWKTKPERYFLFRSLSMAEQSQTAIQKCYLLGKWPATCPIIPSGTRLFLATPGVDLLWPSDHSLNVLISPVFHKYRPGHPNATHNTVRLWSNILLSLGYIQYNLQPAFDPAQIMYLPNCILTIVRVVRWWLAHGKKCEAGTWGRHYHTHYHFCWKSGSDVTLL